MPDISMCQNKECPSKEDCYRFTAKPSEWQAWSIFDFGVGVCCDSYIPNAGASALSAEPGAQLNQRNRTW
jgi:hypothetical protein